MKIPLNKIQDNKHTNDKVLLRYTSTKIKYEGFYNIINGNKYFTGKIYTSESKPLELYSSAQNDIMSSPVKESSYLTGNTIRYFYKDLTSKNILIKEIDKSAYENLSINKSINYQVISYNQSSQSLNDVNKQMSGLKEFLVT